MQDFLEVSEDVESSAKLLPLEEVTASQDAHHHNDESCLQG
jgi:hypothetical protein